VNSVPLRARSSLAPTTVLLLLCALACTFEGYVPRDREDIPVLEEEVVELPIGKMLKTTLDCPAGYCQKRYRIDVPRPGKLTVTALESDEDDSTSTRIVLESLGGKVLARDRIGENERLRVSSQVEPGPYFVLVQSIGARVPLTIAAALGRSDGAVAAASPNAPSGGSFTPAGRASIGTPQAAFDPAVAFAPMRRYAFAADPQTRFDAEPGTKVGNPFLEKEIQRAVRSDLGSRGYDLVSADEAEFLVAVHVGARNTTWYSVRMADRVDAYDYYYDQWRGAGAVIRPHTASDGTVVIDFADPKSGDLLWHGWMTESVPPTGDRYELIKRIVNKILAQFPPTG